MKLKNVQHNARMWVLFPCLSKSEVVIAGWPKMNFFVYGSDVQS